MATTTISDYVIWAKHIHDDPALAGRVAMMRAGETIDLDIEGELGTWRRMEDGKDGRPTLGLKPVGAAQMTWRKLFKTRRGGIARLALAPREKVSTGGPNPAPARDLAPFIRTDAERQAALAALLDGGRQGYRSGGRTLSRDDTHAR